MENIENIPIIDESAIFNFFHELQSGAITGVTDTLYYDYTIYDHIDRFLLLNPPSRIFNRVGQFKWLAVVHQSFAIGEYRQLLGQRNKTRVATINVSKRYISIYYHHQLLDMAVGENVMEGYWLTFCEFNNMLDRLWHCFAREFYLQGRHLRYTRIECCKSNNGGGIIFIFNNDFRDTRTVVGIHQMCQNIIRTYRIPQMMWYYKPVFYKDIKLYWDSTRVVKSYILKGINNLFYEPGVENWLSRHPNLLH